MSSLLCMTGSTPMDDNRSTDPFSNKHQHQHDHMDALRLLIALSMNIGVLMCYLQVKNISLQVASHWLQYGPSTMPSLVTLKTICDLLDKKLCCSLRLTSLKKHCALAVVVFHLNY